MLAEHNGALEAHRLAVNVCVCVVKGMHGIAPTRGAGGRAGNPLALVPLCIGT